MVQRALLSAFAKIGSLRGSGAIEGWLYRITANAARDQRRSIRSRARALERFGAQTKRDPVSAATHPDGDEPLRGLVRTFLAELSDQQRAIMDLVDLQGLSPKEAGERLGLNPSTARVHLLRARRRVRKRILAARPSILEDLRT